MDVAANRPDNDVKVPVRWLQRGAMVSAFVNRVGELSALSAEAIRAAQGEPRVVHVNGPAGIGKTALIDRFLGRHTDLAAILVAGAEAEAGVHLGVAEALLRGLAVRAGQTGAAAEVDPLACGVALVQQLGLVQGPDGAVALIVNDFDWVDPASTVALAFAIRRLTADRILTVLIGRAEIDPETPLGRLINGPRGQCLRLTGLDSAAVREMAATSCPVSAAQAAVLRDHTGGNPLYVRSLLAELPSGEAIDAERLQAPNSFAATALAPLARSTDASRRLVRAASVLGMEARLADAARLGRVPAPAQAVRELPANLVELTQGPLGWTLRFTHPLNRAAVYHDLPPDERARLHALAAEHTVGRVARWHRVRGTLGPDPALAADLISAAAGEAASGQLETAAQDLVAAAQVHPDAPTRHRLVLDAADLRLWASDPAGAAAVLASIEDPSGSRSRYVRGHLAVVTGRLAEAQAELETAWESCGPGDHDLRGPIASLLAHLAILHARGQPAPGGRPRPSPPCRAVTRYWASASAALRWPSGSQASRTRRWPASPGCPLIRP